MLGTVLGTRHTQWAKENLAPLSISSGAASIPASSLLPTVLYYWSPLSQVTSVSVGRQKGDKKNQCQKQTCRLRQKRWLGVGKEGSARRTLQPKKQTQNHGAQQHLSILTFIVVLLGQGVKVMVKMDHWWAFYFTEINLELGLTFLLSILLRPIIVPGLAFYLLAAPLVCPSGSVSPTFDLSASFPKWWPLLFIPIPYTLWTEYAIFYILTLVFSGQMQLYLFL